MNFFSGSAMITQQDNRNELILSSRGGYKAGTRHKVAGPRGMPIIGNYHSPARGSGRERRVFFGGGKKDKLFFFCAYSRKPIVVWGALGRTVVQHMGVTNGSSSCYSVFRCVPFLI